MPLIMPHSRQSGAYFIQSPELDVSVWQTFVTLGCKVHVVISILKGADLCLKYWKKCQSDKKINFRSLNSGTFPSISFSAKQLLRAFCVTKTNKMIIETGVRHFKVMILFNCFIEKMLILHSLEKISFSFLFSVAHCSYIFSLMSDQKRSIKNNFYLEIY